MVGGLKPAPPRKGRLQPALSPGPFSGPVAGPISYIRHRRNPGARVRLTSTLVPSLSRTR